MKLSLHDFVVNRLLAAKGTWPEIAREAGVSLRTIQKIASREIEDPGISHIEKLLAYFTQARPIAAVLRGNDEDDSDGLKAATG